MDCSLPGSSVHEIFQARVLEWGATAFSAQYTTEEHFPIYPGKARQGRGYLYTAPWNMSFSKGEGAQTHTHTHTLTHWKISRVNMLCIPQTRANTGDLYYIYFWPCNILIKAKESIWAIFLHTSLPTSSVIFLITWPNYWPKWYQQRPSPCNV